MNKFLVIIFIVTFMVSCDTGFHSEGLVINKSTQLPIDSVKIHIKDLDSIYTDSVGKYRIDTMIYGYAGYLEILLVKEGYQTKHVNFKNDRVIQDNAIIEMEMLNGSTQEFSLPKKTISLMYYFNLYIISLVNVLTLLFLIFRKGIPWKYFWILGVLLFNLILFISFTDGSVSDFSILNGPVYLTHYWIYPYSVKIVLPLTSIMFWILYLAKHKIAFKIEKEYYQVVGPSEMP